MARPDPEVTYESYRQIWQAVLQEGRIDLLQQIPTKFLPELSDIPIVIAGNQRSAIYFLLEKDAYDLVRYLLQNGAHINDRYNIGEALLFTSCSGLALAKGEQELSVELVSHGSPYNERDLEIIFPYTTSDQQLPAAKRAKVDAPQPTAPAAAADTDTSSAYHPFSHKENKICRECDELQLELIKTCRDPVKFEETIKLYLEKLHERLLLPNSEALPEIKTLYSKLKEKGVDLAQYRFAQGKTLLHLTMLAKEHFFQLTHCLCEMHEFSEQVNTQDHNGNTPLHDLMQAPFTPGITKDSVMKVLIKKGANIFLKNAQDKNVLQEAVQNFVKTVNESKETAHAQFLRYLAPIQTIFEDCKLPNGRVHPSLAPIWLEVADNLKAINKSNLSSTDEKILNATIARFREIGTMFPGLQANAPTAAAIAPNLPSMSK